MGYIYDESTNTPIANCIVGESTTNELGYFNLKEIRYSEFTFVGYEAPPLFVNEAIYKEGYEKKTIELHNPFGGGIRKGALHNMDTIYLKKTAVLISK
ncbi:carboxypeptidase-like regulatory domain-containing protein [Flavobacterium sp. F-65]|uniref:Carboxypeptidase-like regulatory domain-containing protein n=1 Tax=Flavobacterium pisciphilum TaxID=2893755 RepID=A0ABS8MPP6_9FLAO|nr:carboxypeptidase-like regulatory domain-containing protein [Flavobacterium sp. F-65]MCC9070097.1 carboxypeptidase-like regulatory domain-containing protein [Flavobacterium sp. F-65]